MIVCTFQNKSPNVFQACLGLNVSYYAYIFVFFGYCWYFGSQGAAENDSVYF